MSINILQILELIQTLNTYASQRRLTERLKRVGSNDKLGFLRNYEF